ncbi:MAG: DUF2062 domain-containing protein [Candidatus Omnitrophota bacterium]|jgi:uncharacterized protein (DUF2062 family)
MKKGSLLNRVPRFFKAVYLKLFRINDTPEKISAGLALGVFFGILPGMGPFAALFFAFIFRINRAAALLGSILTNTWLSVPVFFLSVNIGSFMTGSNYSDINRTWTGLIKDFSWDKLFHLSIYKIAAPVILGYIAAGLVIGAAAYAVTLGIIKTARNKKTRRLQ